MQRCLTAETDLLLLSVEYKLINYFIKVKKINSHFFAENRLYMSGRLLVVIVFRNFNRVAECYSISYTRSFAGDTFSTLQGNSDESFGNIFK